MRNYGPQLFSNVKRPFERQFISDANKNTSPVGPVGIVLAKEFQELSRASQYKRVHLKTGTRGVFATTVSTKFPFFMSSNSNSSSMFFIPLHFQESLHYFLGRWVYGKMNDIFFSPILILGIYRPSLLFPSAILVHFDNF